MTCRAAGKKGKNRAAGKKGKTNDDGKAQPFFLLPSAQMFGTHFSR